MCGIRCLISLLKFVGEFAVAITFCLVTVRIKRVLVGWWCFVIGGFVVIHISSM